MTVQENKITPRKTQPGDGTAELLRGGGGMVAMGLLAGALLQLFFGGMTKIGATTNAGWIALIVTLMCLPFGALLLTLGVAKWLRNRRLGRLRGNSEIR